MNRCRFRSPTPSSTGCWRRSRPGRTAEAAAGTVRRTDQSQRQGDHPGRRLCRPVHRHRLQLPRYRPRRGVLQHQGRRAGRRRRAGDRLPTRPRHPAVGIPQRKDAVQRRLSAARSGGQGGRRMPGVARRAALPRPVRHVRTPAPVPENCQGQRFQDSARLPRPRRHIRPDRKGADGHRPDHSPVQQRPAGRKLHRRRRAGVDHRLRVLGQQRPLLRTGQHLERVRPVDRPAGRARHRVLRPPVTPQDRQGPPARHRRQVRVDAVGLHPKRLERIGIRLLGLGDGTLRGRRRRIQRHRTSPACSTTYQPPTDARDP